jgi:hypothetical protein
MKFRVARIFENLKIEKPFERKKFIFITNANALWHLNDNHTFVKKKRGFCVELGHPNPKKSQPKQTLKTQPKNHQNFDPNIPKV